MVQVNSRLSVKVFGENTPPAVAFTVNAQLCDPVAYGTGFGAAQFTKNDEERS